MVTLVCIVSGLLLWALVSMTVQFSEHCEFYFYLLCSSGVAGLPLSLTWCCLWGGSTSTEHLVLFHRLAAGSRETRRAVHPCITMMHRLHPAAVVVDLV